MMNINGYVWWNKIDETKRTCVAKRYFCYYCQIQLKTPQEINQHKKTQKDQKNVQGSLTKFNVGDDIITNKDHDLLISDKGWLSDSVSFSDSNFYYLFLSILTYLDHQCLFETYFKFSWLVPNFREKTTSFVK